MYLFVTFLTIDKQFWNAFVNRECASLHNSIHDIKPELCLILYGNDYILIEFTCLNKSYLKSSTNVLSSATHIGVIGSTYSELEIVYNMQNSL